MVLTISLDPFIWKALSQLVGSFLPTHRRSISDAKGDICSTRTYGGKQVALTYAPKNIQCNTLNTQYPTRHLDIQYWVFDVGYFFGV